MRILAVAMAGLNQFSNILLGLRAHGHEVTLLAGSRPAVELPHPVVCFPPPPHRARGTYATTRADFLATGAAVARTLRELPPADVDVVFGQASFGCLEGVPDLLDAPVVAHVELPGLEVKAARPEFPMSPEALDAHRVRRELVEARLRASRLVVTPSSYARSLLPGDVRARTRVAMEGFETSPPLPAGARRRLRRSLGLPPDGPVIGFLGRTLEAVRGFDVFLEVARQVLREVPGTTVLVVGGHRTLYGNELDHLRGEAFASWALRRSGLTEDEVRFTGFVGPAEFRRYVQAADVAVFPLFEGAGTWSLFDTMAAGTPVVAARRCFVPEVVTDGDEGFLCDVRDATAMALGVVELITRPERRRAMADAAWRRIAADFSLEAAVDRYEAILTEGCAP